MLEIIGAISGIAGICGVIFANALLFIRHSILGRYGCSTGWDGFFFPGLDARLFRQLAEAVDSDQLRNVFGWVKTLIPALGIGGIVLFFIGCALM